MLSNIYMGAHVTRERERGMDKQHLSLKAACSFFFLFWTISSNHRVFWRLESSNQLELNGGAARSEMQSLFVRTHEGMTTSKQRSTEAVPQYDKDHYHRLDGVEKKSLGIFNSFLCYCCLLSTYITHHTRCMHASGDALSQCAAG